MFHRSVFERCGPFDESIGFAEDYEFWLRCCLLHGYRLYLVLRNIARYRMHESQLSSTHAGETDDNNGRIWSMVLARLPEAERGRYMEAAALVRDPPPRSRLGSGLRRTGRCSHACLVGRPRLRSGRTIGQETTGCTRAEARPRTRPHPPPPPAGGGAHVAAARGPRPGARGMRHDARSVVFARNVAKTPCAD